MSVKRGINPGIGFVPAYEISGIPFVTSSIPAEVGTTSAVSVRFPYVTRWIEVVNTGAKPLRIGFSKNGVEGKTKLKIHTPLINLSKGDIIKRGIEEGVDFSLTNSCYDPQDNGAPCGRCDSCLLRAKGFEEAKELDPLLLKYGLS